MSILYFDCFSGISGDMALGALLDLGGEREKTYFLEEMKKIPLEGYQIVFDRTAKNGIGANSVKVELTEHQHCHRHLKDVYDIIEQSGITKHAKDLAKRIFLRLASAEAKVHQEALEMVHFHEVGAVDSLVDIIGCAVLIDYWKPEQVHASVIQDGYGFIECAHGVIPVPVPATAEIFAQAGVSSRQIEVEAELVTPTGAAIIAELASSYGTMPQIKISNIGWGAGTKDLKIPNVLRIYQGTLMEDKDHLLTSEKEQGMRLSPGGWDADQIALLETNLDDCTGEMLGYAMERLLAAGALDVYYTPIFMKKNRPAYLLGVLCNPDETVIMEALIFQHTTTIGIRKCLKSRSILRRKQEVRKTKWGDLEGKIVLAENGERFYPEYDSARRLAEQSQVSLIEIYRNIASEKVQ